MTKDISFLNQGIDPYSPELKALQDIALDAALIRREVSEVIQVIQMNDIMLDVSEEISQLIIGKLFKIRKLAS